MVIATALTFAFAVLSLSVLRTASVRYEFSSPVDKSNSKVLAEEDINIDYNLAFPGRVLPDHILWPVKALRDKVWLLITTSQTRKAELKLLFADKRLGSAKILFQREKPEIGFSTLTKSEKYLEEAVIKERENREKGLDTSEFLQRLANASLKHYEVMEEIKAIAPEDAGPKIVEVQDYAIRAYESSRDGLLEEGIEPPENPFDW